MDLLGDMPVINCSFEDAFLFYKERGRGDQYRKAVCDYIKLTNKPYGKSVMDYCRRRVGDWDREDKVEKELMFRRRAKKEEERLRKWEG